MALTDDDLRHIHEALAGRIGADNADTFLDYLDVPRDWRRLIPGHPGTRPAVLPEVRLRRFYEALVDWMGERPADTLMELLRIHEVWYRQPAAGTRRRILSHTSRAKEHGFIAKLSPAALRHRQRRRPPPSAYSVAMADEQRHEVLLIPEQGRWLYGLRPRPA